MEGSKDVRRPEGVSQIPPAAGEKELHPPEDVESGKVLAILSYLIPILAVVPLAMKQNKFAIFHARQALLLLGAEVILWIVGGVSLFTGFVAFLIWPILSIGWLCAVVLAVIGIVNSAQGQYKSLPIVGKYGEEWFKTLG